VIINSLVAAVCSTFIGALSYGVGNALGMRLDQRPMEMLITLIATSQSIGWGLLGAIVGGVAGLIVGAIQRKPAGLLFIGMILGAVAFVVDNPWTTGSAMDGAINWATIAGVGGLLTCAMAEIAKCCKKLPQDGEDHVRHDDTR
jgi:hypothetical protein